MRFTRRGDGVEADPDALEVQVLGQLCRELLEVIEQPAKPRDPLAALIGMPDGDVEPPDDSVLRRLLPDAYQDDPAAAGEFRRYTDADLRAGKRANAQTVLASLPEGGGVVVLTRDEVDPWLTCLNDMRLALGTALGVTEETDPDDEDDDEDDPANQALHIYGWLGWLQESLLSCVEPRPPAAG